MVYIIVVFKKVITIYFGVYRKKCNNMEKSKKNIVILFFVSTILEWSLFFV